MGPYNADNGPDSNKGSLVVKFIKCILLTTISAFLLSGCATIGTYNPATGRKEFIAISTASEVNMGKNVHKELIQKYKLSDDKEKIERLREIGQRLAAASDRQDYKYNFYLFRKDTINAFTTPGGNIYMFEGLYDKLETDDGIAAVLAHEMGHCAAKHVVKRIQATLGYNIISTLIYTHLKIEEKKKKQIAYAANSIMSLTMLGYSRKDEYMSDKLGIKYMRLAGYDPEGMLKAFKVLKENSKGPQGPIILRSHPYLDDRIEQARIEIEKGAERHKNPYKSS